VLQLQQQLPLPPQLLLLLLVSGTVCCQKQFPLWLVPLLELALDWAMLLLLLLALVVTADIPVLLVCQCHTFAPAETPAPKARAWSAQTKAGRCVFAQDIAVKC
jgi:hypothetical protein